MTENKKLKRKLIVQSFLPLSILIVIKSVTKETLADLLSVDPELWKAECKGIHEFYAKFGDKLPQRLADELSALEARLG